MPKITILLADENNSLVTSDNTLSSIRVSDHSIKSNSKAKKIRRLSFDDLDLSVDENTIPGSNAGFDVNAIKLDALKTLLSSKAKLKLDSKHRQALNRNAKTWMADSETLLEKIILLTPDSERVYDTRIDPVSESNIDFLVDQKKEIRLSFDASITEELTTLAKKLPNSPDRLLVGLATSSGLLMLGAPATLISTALLTTLYAQTSGLSGLISNPTGIIAIVVGAIITAAAITTFGYSVHRLRFPKKVANSVLSQKTKPADLDAGSNSNKSPDTLG